MRITVNRTELYVDVEGPELAVADDGQLHARPTVVVLHGGPGFDQGYLRPGLRPLADDAQLVFVDLRGQGRSAPGPAAACTLEAMADDVAALCVTLGIRRPILFGHSGGGFVALHVAVRHPDLAGGLILCHTSSTLAATPDPAQDLVTDPTAPPPGPFERGGPDAARAADRLFGGDFSTEAVEDFTRLVMPLYAGSAHEDVPARLMALSRLDSDIAAHFFTRLARRYDLRTRLPTITAPTLVVVGRHDWVCPPSAGRVLAAGIAGARLIELPDAGHFGFSESPAPFLAAVRAFLGSLAVASGA
jgi:proline iminopeptidase